jgi:hypothetical protein
MGCKSTRLDHRRVFGGGRVAWQLLLAANAYDRREVDYKTRHKRTSTVSKGGAFDVPESLMPLSPNWLDPTDVIKRNVTSRLAAIVEGTEHRQGQQSLFI